MTSQLVKQLEDAGLTWDDDQPSLAELIEACKASTDTVLLNSGNGISFATGITKETPVTAKFGSGSDDETAVAHLWIALNEKWIHGCIHCLGGVGRGGDQNECGCRCHLS